MTHNNSPKITMSAPDLTDAERQAVWEVINTPMLSIGPRIQAFEESFRRYTGCQHAIGVNSGTSGLHLCVRAAGVGMGDRVITSPFSFVSSTNVLLFENAVPVFVDVDERTGNLDPVLTAQAAADLAEGGAAAQRWLPRRGAEQSGALKALLAVDVFGQPADYDLLSPIARQHNLKLIEDSCEALGAQYKNRMAGMLGDYGVFAFYPNKQITTGEGGMIVTNDSAAAELMTALRNQGRAPGDTWLSHTYLGYNYRMDEMSAALGTAQMARIEELLVSRQRVADLYNQHLAGLPGIEIPYLAPETTRVSWFVYVIRVARGVDREALAARLAQRGIPVRPYFLPIHLQPYMVERFGYREGDFPITEDLGRRGLALPFSGKMDEEQVAYVCQGLRELL
ncbi:polysaccharide biosynthesis protein [Ornatilinea apprima]|uniref:Polysaccharide biosynthesis protein n=1 Tax=Ornatilinea apprima TaxID=1134406 RepID=A0A0P6XP36_9CHLR|nr:DegT/DnrJ/EryC1/StrS family aminotransferase [Ornatilinea apprima]KPL77020.1 polysaccharide biosynthesis protein [Ornatilinea apprima]